MPFDFGDPKTYALMNLGAGMLAGGAPSYGPPKNFLGVLGGAAPGALNSMMMARQQNQQEEYRKMQMQQMEAALAAQKQKMEWLQNMPSGAGPVAPQSGVSDSSASAMGAPWAASSNLPQPQAPTGPSNIPLQYLMQGAKAGVDVTPFLKLREAGMPDMVPVNQGGQISFVDKRNMQPGTSFQVSAAPGAKPYNRSDLTPEQARAADLVEKATGSTKVDVKVPINLGNNKYSETVNAKAADRDIAQHEVVNASVGNIQKLGKVKEILDSGQPITGIAAELQLDLERAKAKFLQDKEAGQKVSDTQYLRALLGSDVFPMIKSLGIGARGLDTPAEREFLIGVMTGDIPLDKKTLLRMTNDRMDREVSTIKNWNKRVDNGELDRYFKDLGIAKQKIDVPEFKSSPDVSIPPDAIRRLKMNPKERDLFDAAFGQGSAAKVLGR